MRKITLFITTLLLLSGCVTKMNIQQGNVIEQENYNKLHKGMTREEVTSLVGSPVMINTFRDNRVDYIYTNKPGYGKGEEMSFTLVFQRNRLTGISPLTRQEFGR